MALILSAFKYLSVFAISLLFIKLSEQELRFCNIHKRHSLRFYSLRKLRAYAYGLAGMLIISVFAAIRADNVGTDTSGYPVRFMGLARASGSLSGILNGGSELADEPLGAMLVYFCSLFTDETWLLLFFYQFITIFTVFVAVTQFKDYLSVTDAMAVYLFVFFNNSLNMMRQSMGCALILLGLAYLISNQSILKACAAFLAAIFLHRSSVFGIILILSVYYSFRISKRTIQYLLCFFVIAAGPLMTTIAGIVAHFTTDAHVLFYLDVFINKKVDIDWFVDPLSLYSLVYIVVSFCLLLMPLVFQTDFLKKVKRIEAKNYIELIQYKFSVFNLLGFLLYNTLLFSLHSMYGMRFSIFYDFMYILSIPLSAKKTILYREIMYVMLFAYWFLWIMRMGWSGSTFYQVGLFQG